MIYSIEGFNDVDEESVAWEVVFLAELQHPFDVEYCVSSAFFNKANSLFFEHTTSVRVYACGNY